MFANEGDLVNIPTGIFRAFENVGDGYGMLMAILGGDDAGGGVTWAPEVINDAKDFGLVLGDNGLIYDTKRGDSLPEKIEPMELLNEDELKKFPKVSIDEFMNNFFVSASDLSSHSKNSPVKVIGRNGLLKDRPGFEVDFISNETFVDEMRASSQYEVNMVTKGEWALEWDGNSTNISAGDTCLIRPDLSYKMTPIGPDKASLFKVTKTNDPAGSTWRE